MSRHKTNLRFPVASYSGSPTFSTGSRSSSIRSDGSSRPVSPASKSGLSYRISERKMAQERDDFPEESNTSSSSRSKYDEYHRDRKADADWGHFVDFYSPTSADRKFLAESRGGPGRQASTSSREP